ncbi:zinc finger protein 862-like, partial [Lissotriton helveticus]
MTIRSQMENTRFISVLSDGSTDKGIQEQELIYIRFVCEGTLVTNLCDIVSMKNSTASGVKNAIMVGLESMGISLDILSQKCIGLNTDGAAVNLGTKSGAVKQLLDEVSKHQGWDNCNHIAVVHCVAHNLELAVCDVKKKSSYISKFEEVLKGCFKLYYYSPKRRRELKEIADNLEEQLQHFGGLQQIRWVASQHRAVTALKTNWEATVLYLEHLATGTDEYSNKAKGLLHDMKSEKFLYFLHFMIDFTELLQQVSKAFQQDDTLISEVARRIEVLQQKLILLKTKPGKALTQFQLVFKDGNFAGVPLLTQAKPARKGSSNETSVKEDTIELIENALSFMSDRFLKHISGKPHSLFNIFDFSLWPDSVEKIRVFGDQEFEELVMYYKKVLTDEEVQSAPGEWLDFKLYIFHRRMSHTPVSLFTQLLKKRPEEVKNVLPILEIMLSISPTTAICERGFSSMNRIKNELRMS